jgi:hypothetical protein
LNKQQNSDRNVTYQIQRRSLEAGTLSNEHVAVEDVLAVLVIKQQIDANILRHTPGLVSLLTSWC